MTSGMGCPWCKSGTFTVCEDRKIRCGSCGVPENTETPVPIHHITWKEDIFVLLLLVVIVGMFLFA